MLEALGWDQAEELVCDLAAKMLGRDRGAPELRLAAIRMFEPVNTLVDGSVSFPQGEVCADLLSGCPWKAR